jgi:hypothetical protein
MYALANFIFIEPDRASAISTCPEMQLGDVFLMTHQLAMYPNCALSFQKSDHHRDSLPRRHAHAYVDVISDRFRFDQFQSFLMAKIAQNRPNPVPCPHSAYRAIKGSKRG